VTVYRGNTRDNGDELIRKVQEEIAGLAGEGKAPLHMTTADKSAANPRQPLSLRELFCLTTLAAVRTDVRRGAAGNSDRAALRAALLAGGNCSEPVRKWNSDVPHRP
jgi:hypothetical protein